LLIGKSKEECLYNVHQTINILEYLGFVVNYKSILITFLGFQYNSLDMSNALPIEKKSKLKSLMQSFCNKMYCKIQEFARWLGVLVSACHMVTYILSWRGRGKSFWLLERIMTIMELL